MPLDAPVTRMVVLAIIRRVPSESGTILPKGEDQLSTKSPVPSVQISCVESRAAWRRFHHLPHRIYRNDPHWIPPLLLERKLHFNPKHNPFFQHAEAQFFLACQDGQPVGRISAQVDHLHLARYGDHTGHFGFIEAIDNRNVFGALIEAAEGWLRSRGIKRVLGPVSFSMWDQPGLLVEGFDTPPSVMMGHARPYFAGHIEASGYRMAEDLIAYRYGPEITVPKSMQRIVKRTLQKGDIVVRSIRKEKKFFEAEVALLLDIINDAWSGNWGYVEMTKAEIDDFAGLLRFLLRPGDVAIAEYRGQAAAFAAMFPNVNEAIRDLNGRILPLGWAKLLWRLKVSRPRTARMPLMGVRKSLQDSAVGAALAFSVIDASRSFIFDHGVAEIELSWILARNRRIRHVIEVGVGGVPYKRYRIYEKML